MTTETKELPMVSVAFAEKMIAWNVDVAERKATDKAHDQYRLSESSYGATQSAVVVLRAKGFQQLRSMLRERRMYRGGDNPGQIYATDCKPIYIHHGDHGALECVCIAMSHRDI